MRALSEWLKEYGESHQNPINQKIHTIAVPGIYLS
ncbi:Mpo1-like protein, partial [Vibrio antiquarius]